MVSEVLGVMTRLAREGMTMIVVTHEMRFARQVSSRVLFFADGVVYEDGTPDQLFDHPQRERTRQFIQQIHETTFTIESAHFDWYAMMSQMEQFCQQYNLSHQQTESVRHVVDESLTILQSGGNAIEPGTRLTLSYTEQDDSLLFTINSPQAINRDIFAAESDDIAVTILRNFSRDISIDGNLIRIIVKS
jgi:polar amino acid transport system substrate-binding protein